MIAEARICWPRNQIMRHESLWCIFWKLGRANAMSPETLAGHFGKPDAARRDQRALLPPLLRASRFDVPRLAAAAEVRETEFGVVGVDQLFRFQDRFERWWVWRSLRFCPVCLEEGFHSVVFQLRGVTRCPYHDQPLIGACPSCQAAIPLAFCSGDELSCPECGHVVGAFGTRPRREGRNGRQLDDIIRWVRRVRPAAAEEEAHVANHNFTNAQTPGLSLHEPGYHRSNAFRYAADLYGLHGHCPAPRMLSADTTPVVVGRRRRVPFPRLRRAMSPEHAYFVVLARHYLRVVRRLRRRVRSPRMIHSNFKNNPDVLHTADWAYLIARALWEQRSVWSLDDYSTRDGRVSVLDAAELGEGLHQCATQYFRFISATGRGRGWSNSAWANLHLWTIAFSQTVDRINAHFAAGGQPEQTEFATRAFDGDLLPFAMFRYPCNAEDRAELVIWPIPAEVVVRDGSTAAE